ncbi:unnamed protein product [Pleuronectes platessa]|uniref:Uncharacterized protein n=1 Tax=Pleuronectes platessa TaxID=8262 RepID=A0A9N7YFC8_PLEPL|nr:unnamed protein product [Pleuronectes platessa]
MSYDQFLKEEDLSEETRPNSVPRARRIRSISGPSTKPLQQMNQRYPAQAMTSSPNSGDSLTACTPRNTTRSFTGLLENPRHAQATPRRSQ